MPTPSSPSPLSKETLLTADADWVRRWYGELAQQFGDDHRSLGFNQRTSQQKRFEALCELGDFNGRRLLDVGCGLGHFLLFLRQRGVHPEYTGLDITPELIGHARARFQGESSLPCGFEVGDTLTYEPHKPFDFVVASGIFGLLSAQAEGRIAPTMHRLFSWATVGMAINFLSNRAPRQAKGRLYVDPSRMLSLALELTPAVRLHHNYLPNDFTLYLFKDPAWSKESQA